MFILDFVSMFLLKFELILSVGMSFNSVSITNCLDSGQWRVTPPLVCDPIVILSCDGSGVNDETVCLTTLSLVGWSTTLKSEESGGIYRGTGVFGLKNEVIHLLFTPHFLYLVTTYHKLICIRNRLIPLKFIE